MAASVLKSRPVYKALTPRPGLKHLIVADGQGGDAVLDMAATVPADFFGKTHILYIRFGSGDAERAERLRRLKPASMLEAPSLASALPRLQQILATSHMGTRLYLAGTEGLIGQAIRLAIEAGMEHASIEAEHRGTLARRVQCVHCKGVTENVTTQPVTCSHCGLTLFVRDHYSRRIAAFQGVCIDAEEPGVVPPVEEAFR